MLQTKIKDVHIRNEREAAIAEKYDKIAERLEEYADENDEKGMFPYASFAILREAGFFSLTVPQKYGGYEASLYEMAIALERLAKGDGAVALAAGWQSCLFLNYREGNRWREEVFAKVCQDVVQNGDILNIFATEKKGGNIFRGSQPETIARRTAGGYLISGEKTFATLAPIADPLIVMAWVEDEGVLGEFLIRKSDKVVVKETWNTIGMRSTGSDTIVLNEVFVSEESLLAKATGKDGGLKNRSTFLFIASVFLGVAHAARDFIIDFAKHQQAGSLNKPIAEVPHIQQKIGEIEINLTTSRTLLYSLADKWDRFPQQRDHLLNDFQAAKYTICHQAIRIVEIAMRIAGGRGLSKDFKLERLFRDVQCGLSMHPADDMIVQGLARSVLYSE
ncbi:acyl-CoA dehydrogenase family protein [Cytobacillus sp. OWB-43]|uniref:acyl-CoA dehydrogenase family protein n=1 Tax=Cytobacillus sp. OWB-43 TaxID=3108468 RepID=UPI002AFFCE8B|nr:acyl-CoA dehydrogenase family protein [Cytobacillus sp. OWB-43]MEA1853600.1 acyl-CoA dehydrogenase family protein [Cytobacillus sp. OWB-43]